MEVRGLGVEVGGRRLLDNVWVTWPAGELAGILGQSGSGKSTLLKLLGNRWRGRGTRCGVVLLNGGPVTECGFVAQSDASVCEFLSPFENVRYRSRLTGGRFQGDDLLKELEFSPEAMKTVCSRASGGERRRTAIALALVSLKTKDAPFLVDEGTSGLDAITALSVVRLLKGLAVERPVICSIHVPSSPSFQTFDSIAVLSDGLLIYHGSRSDLASYLTSVLDVTVDAFYNPADAVIDVCATSDSRDLHRKFNAFRSSPPRRTTLVTTTAEEKKMTEEATRIVALVEREIVLLRRDLQSSVGYIFQCLCMGVVVGLIFFQLTTETNDVVVARPGLMYLLATNVTYVSLVFSTFLYSRDAKLFDRERDDGVTSALAHWLSYIIARVPLYAVATSAYYLPLSYLADLRGSLLVTLAIGFALQLTVLFMAMTFAGVARDFDIASLIGNAVFTFTSMSSGFLVNPTTFHLWNEWWRSISFNGFAFSLFIRNEFRSIDIPGKPTLLSQLDVLPHKSALIGLLCYLLVFAGLSLFTASYFVHDADADHIVVVKKTDEKPPKSDDLEEPLLLRGHHSEDEQLAPLNSEQQQQHRGMTVRLEGLWLSTTKKQKMVLCGATATFPATGLSVLLGESGAGKSSILDAVAGRTQLKHTAGTITFDDEPVGPYERRRPSRWRNATAYVTQSVALLPALKVRETLNFSAGLACIIQESRKAVVDKWLTKLGLLKCSETLASRCSGGERRRIAVAIQLLTSPPCCCLDEPTTGLDAAASWDVLAVLGALAKDTSVIATLHSPRSDVFQLFETIVLVAKGTIPFSGPAVSAVTQCEALTNDKCVQHTNPADFLLLCAMELGGKDATGDDEVLLECVPPTKKDRQLRMTKRAPESWRAYAILVQRGIINTIRQPALVVARAMQVISFALIIAYFYGVIGFDQAAVQNRAGAMFEWCALVFIGMLNCMAIFPAERDVFLREHLDGSYGPGPFLLAYMTLEMPLNGACGLIFSLLMTLAVGMRGGLDAVLIRADAVTAVISVGESVAIAICACVDSPGFALSLVSLNLAVSNILAGFLAVSMPPFVKAINTINPIHYMATSIANLEFHDSLHFTCHHDEDSCIHDGTEALTRYGYKNCGRCVGKLVMLAVYSGAARLLAYLLLVRRTSKSSSY